MKMRRLIGIHVVLSLVLSLTLPAYGVNEPEYTFKLGHDQALATPYHVAAVVFSEAVERDTNGKIKINIFPNAVLGDEISMLDSVRLGDLDFSITAAPNAATHVPELGFFGVGYLFKDYNHFKAAMTNDEIIDEVSQIVAKKNLGVHFMGFLTTGVRTMYAIKPVRNLNDIKKLKMRVMASPVEAKVWKTLGTLPVSIPFQEVYSAMQTGVIEAAENTPLVYLANKHQEVAPYLILTQHQFMCSLLWMNEQLYNSLPTDLQKVLQSAVKEMTVKCIEKTELDEAMALAEMEEKYGVTVVKDVDKAQFMNKLAPLQDEVAKELGMEIVLKVIRELAE